jgi:hypothetical protein
VSLRLRLTIDPSTSEVLGVTIRHCYDKNIAPEKSEFSISLKQEEECW